MPDILIDRQDPHFSSTLSYQVRQKLRADLLQVNAPLDIIPERLVSRSTLRL